MPKIEPMEKFTSTRLEPSSGSYATINFALSFRASISSFSSLTSAFTQAKFANSAVMISSLLTSSFSCVSPVALA